MQKSWWSLTAADREALARDPLFAFSAAAILSDRTLQQEAEISCLGADMSAIKKKIWLQAPEVERLRLVSPSLTASCSFRVLRG